MGMCDNKSKEDRRILPQGRHLIEGGREGSTGR